MKFEKSPNIIDINEENNINNDYCLREREQPVVENKSFIG